MTARWREMAAFSCTLGEVAVISGTYARQIPTPGRLPCPNPGRRSSPTLAGSSHSHGRMRTFPLLAGNGNVWSGPSPIINDLRSDFSG